jgi:hypothetical protein
VQEEAMKRRAMALGEKIRAEDGIGRAVALIETTIQGGESNWPTDTGSLFEIGQRPATHE